MRTTALPSMLDTLARNYNNRNGAVALFELASEYYPVEGQELPDEKTKLIAGLYGDDCDSLLQKVWWNNCWIHCLFQIMNLRLPPTSMLIIRVVVLIS